jgi:hypothetical protein
MEVDENTGKIFAKKCEFKRLGKTIGPATQRSGQGFNVPQADVLVATVSEVPAEPMPTDGPLAKSAAIWANWSRSA